jgi:protein-S-isoprenylcysteine O-methyltransferase Ste14
LIGRRSEAAVLSGIDRSAWVSWSAYTFTFALAAEPVTTLDIMAGRPVAWVLLAGIVLFFSIILPIQRHMRLSLTANTYGTPRHLVVSGPFRVSRNPIYVAFLVPLSSLAWLSWPVAVAGMALYLVAMTYYVIAREEEVLEREFGAEYLDYHARTPRWLGLASIAELKTLIAGQTPAVPLASADPR